MAFVLFRSEKFDFLGNFPGHFPENFWTFGNFGKTNLFAFSLLTLSVFPKLQSANAISSYKDFKFWKTEHFPEKPLGNSNFFWVEMVGHESLLQK